MNLGLFLFFIFVIVINVIIGYVIAVLFGIGPPDFRTGWNIIQRFSLRTRISGLAGFIRDIHKPDMTGVVDRLASFLAWFKSFGLRRSVDSEPEPIVKESTDEKLQKISAKDVKDYLEDESAIITRISPVPELFDDNLMNIIFEQGTETWMAADKHIETSIHKLNLIMMQSGQFSGELDEKLRSMSNDVSIDEVRDSFEQTISDNGMRVTESALSAAAEATFGYPFLIQLIGYHTWRAANQGLIDDDAAAAGINAARRRLGSLVHETALADLSDVDRTFLAAMAPDDGPSKLADIRHRMGDVSSQHANTYRERLLAAQMIRTAGHGRVEMALPYLRGYLRDHIATFGLLPDQGTSPGVASSSMSNNKD